MGASTDRHTWRTFLGPKPSPTTADARALQASATRRFWSTFLDRRDWVSFIYVPLIVPILILLPYFAKQYYEWNYHTNLLLQSVSQGSPALNVLNRLLRDGPDKPWVGTQPGPDGRLEPLDFRGYDLLQLSQTTDLRRWKPDVDGQKDSVHRYVTLKVRKEVENPPGGSLFRYRMFSSRPDDQFRFPTQDLEPKLRKVCDGEDSGPGENDCWWEASWDFAEVPAGEWRDLILEGQSNGTFLKRGVNSTHMTVEFPTEVSEANFWILMPRRSYRDWWVLRQTKGTTGSVEAVKPATEFLAHNQEIIAFKLLAVKPSYTYELSWNYR